MVALKLELDVALTTILIRAKEKIALSAASLERTYPVKEGHLELATTGGWPTCRGPSTIRIRLMLPLSQSVFRTWFGKLEVAA
jgi:hypothetical protein